VSREKRVKLTRCLSAAAELLVYVLFKNLKTKVFSKFKNLKNKVFSKPLFSPDLSQS